MHRIYRIAILSTFIAFITIYVVKIAVSSQARGIIRSEEENVKLSTVISGKVRYLKLKNDQSVRKGDTLMVVESPTIAVQLALKRELRSDYNQQIADLKQLIESKGSVPFKDLHTELFQKELAYYRRQIAERKVKVERCKRTYQRTLTLFKGGVVSRADLEKATYDYKAAETNMYSLQEQQINAWQAKRREGKEKLKNIESDIEKLHKERENYIITAPISGEIMDYSGVQKGSFISASQTLAEIAPNGSLVAECYVSPRDIGLIRNDQAVNLQIDAYNYNQWGLVHARVIEISKNISIQNNTSFFKVRCALLQDHLSLKNGYQAQVKKGMTLTARFILQKRTLWEVLYDNIDDWLNPNLDLRSNPAKK